MSVAVDTPRIEVGRAACATTLTGGTLEAKQVSTDGSAGTRAAKVTWTACGAASIQTASE